jgi:hypothetical protein
MSKALRNDEVIETIPNGDAHPELNGGEEEQQVPGTCASPLSISS